MSLITMGYGHLTVITMGLGTSVRVYSPFVYRPVQRGTVRFVDDTPEIEEVDEIIKVEMTNSSEEVKYD